MQVCTALLTKNKFIPLDIDNPHSCKQVALITRRSPNITRAQKEHYLLQLRKNDSFLQYVTFFFLVPCTPI